MKLLLSAGMIQGGRSGVGRYVISLAEALVREQPEVMLHVAGAAEDRKLFPFLPEGRWLEIPVKYSKGPLNLLWHLVFLPGELSRGGFDLVHIPSYRRILATSPVPQVATIHDCAPFVLRDKYDAFRGIFGRGLVPVLARRVPRIIAVSETTRQDIIRFMKVPGDRITAIWNGIDHTMFHPRAAADVDSFRARKNLKKPFFLYVARLEHPAKNHLRLIKAFEKLVDSGDFDGELILPGAPWHGSEIITDAVAASPHRDRIRLEGFVDNEDLPLWYAAAEALVFPSLMEGFGLPLVEAQACGTRITSADATSLPEVAGPAGILFDGLDVDRITAALRQLATMDATERERREEQGKEWAGRFTWSAHAERAVEIYRAALAQR